MKISSSNTHIIEKQQELQENEEEAERRKQWKTSWRNGISQRYQTFGTHCNNLALLCNECTFNDIASFSG